VATTFTANALLQKPATADRNWDVPLNANSDFLDGVAAIGRLLVTPTETPSATLNVRVTAGTYVKSDGSVGSFPGAGSYGLPASTSTALWLTDPGVLSASAAFPTTPHVRLATVVTGPGSVQSVTDERIGPRTCGTGVVASGAGATPAGPETVSVPFSVVSPSTGVTTFAADPTVPAVGFFGAAPATQAPALAAITDATTGVASASVVDVGSTFSQALIDNNFATLTARVNALTGALKRHGLMAS
jgi:hypothetical protein